MTAFVLINSKIMYDGRNLSGITSQVALNAEVDLQDITTFGDTFKRRLAGLYTTSLNVDTYWESISASDSHDKDTFEFLNAGKKLISVSGEGGVVADVGYMFEGDLESYNLPGSIGELYKVSIVLQGNNKLMRGQVVENSTRTSTGNGSVVEAGVVASGSTIYSGLHVVEVSGSSPTLDVIVESDTASTFLSAVTRITHAQKIAVGSELLSLAGDITDNWWRVVMNISGSSPSFTAYHTLAILVDSP